MLELLSDTPVSTCNCFTGRVVIGADGSCGCSDDPFEPVRLPKTTAVDVGSGDLGGDDIDPVIQTMTASTATPAAAANAAPWFSQSADGNFVIMGRAVSPVVLLGGLAAAWFLLSSMDGKK